MDNVWVGADSVEVGIKGGLVRWQPRWSRF